MSLTQPISAALDSRKKQSTSTVQYSKKPKGFNYSTVQYTEAQIVEMLRCMPDVVPEDGYDKFYINRFNELGYERFMFLVARARFCAESRPTGDPRKLFCWMLKNPALVR